jgi:hypothetical protein
MSQTSLAPDAAPPGRCGPCQAGPWGIAGHEDLFSQTMGADHMHFRCRACGTLWVRHADAALRYSWTASSRLTGPDTPGKQGMAPP